MVAASTYIVHLMFVRQISGVSLAENLMPFGYPTPFLRYSTGFYTRGLTENSLKPIMAGVELFGIIKGRG